MPGLDVFDSVLSTADWGVVPQENSTFGSVIETYDNLRRPDAKFVRGEITLQVQHCLLVRRGVKLDDIKKIMSHEQVSESLFDSTSCSGYLELEGTRSMSDLHCKPFSIRFLDENDVDRSSRTSPS